ncbi:MAG: PKD domain-containing protein [Candidatus Nanoarchaeia archaeon]|nr:PKD domain-containing protein [Candidatus Nanoarchaeia archaeon]MDD5587568.1 PKD domain-containing protein [Candidatus Nanoarchaeia archaeon]
MNKVLGNIILICFVLILSINLVYSIPYLVSDITCIDSDGGNKPFTQGSVVVSFKVDGILRNFTLKDACTNYQKTLFEYNCLSASELPQITDNVELGKKIALSAGIYNCTCLNNVCISGTIVTCSRNCDNSLIGSGGGTGATCSYTTSTCPSWSTCVSGSQYCTATNCNSLTKSCTTGTGAITIVSGCISTSETEDTEILCANNIDDDCDGSMDCADSECKDFCATTSISLPKNPTINISLIKNYGPGEKIQGLISFNNLKRLPSSTKVIVEVGDKRITKNLIDLCKNCGTIKEFYNLSNKGQNIPEESRIIEFAKADTITKYALVIPQVGVNDIQKAEFSLTGLPKNSFYPNSPKLDLNQADGKYDWEYTGPLKLDGSGAVIYQKINSDYLASLIPSSETYKIYGGERYEYCERVKLPKTKKYLLEAYVKKTSQTGGQLNFRIRHDGALGYSTEFDDKEGNIRNLECTSQEPSTSYSWKSCEIDVSNVDLNEEYNLICVYSKADNDEAAYYDIATEDYSLINKGYKCDPENCVYAEGFDYFIRAYFAAFDPKFSTTENVNLINSFSEVQCNYISSINNIANCIFPLTFVSNSQGKLQLTNLNLEYGGMSSSKLIGVNYNPETLNYAGSLNLTNKDFMNLTTPLSEGDYTLKVKLIYGTSQYASKEFEIEVFPTPSASLDVPETGIVNTDIPCNFSIDNSTGFKFSWNFGDGKNATIKEAKHSYDNIGFYNITLQVTDLNGVVSTFEKSIEIISAEQTLITLLDTTKLQLDNVLQQLNSLSGDVSSVTTTLNLKQKVNDAKLAVDGYNSEYNSALIMTGVAKEQKISAIYNKLLTLRKTTVSQVSISNFGFSPKLSIPDQIPDKLFSSVSDIGTAKNDIFAIQDKIEVTSKAYLVNLQYLAGEQETLRLVKKTVSVSDIPQGSSIVEYIPKEAEQSITDKNILSSGFTIIAADPIISWPASSSVEITYKLSSGDLESLSKTRTFLFVPITEESVEKYTCGDNICDLGEETTCKADCEIKSPILFYIFIIVLIIIVLGIGGYYLYEKYGTKKKYPFVNKESEIRLEAYIKKEQANRLPDIQIKSILVKKGWKKEQLDFVFNKIIKEKKAKLNRKLK